MNSEVLGAGLELYAILLAFYGGLFVVVQLGLERLPFSARSAYRVLFFGWALGTFFGNYAFYRFLGIMSFLPWLNNFLHTFVWIGLVLGWLYFASLNQPLWRRFVMFAAFSFAVKVAERQLLGSWDFPHFLGIYGSWAYILGWSLADGLYPILSDAGLKLIARMRPGFHAPQPSRYVLPLATAPAVSRPDMPTSPFLRRRVLTLLLWGLAVWDLALAAVAMFLPGQWFRMFHDMERVDPAGLLTRTGAVWLAFAVFQGVAALRWQANPRWLAVVAGLRLSEIFADLVYVTAARHVTALGTAALIGSTIANIVLAVYFLKASHIFSGEDPVAGRKAA